MPRTHRGAERFPGMTITYALMQTFEKLAEQSDRAKIINKAKVTKLITNDSPNRSLFEGTEETAHLSNGTHVVGCVYEKGGVETKEYGPVILTSGGFGADFGNDSLLAKYRPDLLHLPTTNGEHCTGDAIKMGNAIKARPCLVCTWQGRLLVASMATTVLEATLFWIAWSLVALPAAMPLSTCSARLASSRCTLSTLRIRLCHR